MSRHSVCAAGTHGRFAISSGRRDVTNEHTLEETAWSLFEAHRTGTATLTQKAGSFIGQIAVDPAHPLSERQQRWLSKLVERAGLPPLISGGVA
jgi:hypothetical protein